MSQVEKQKLQNHVPAVLMRQLDIEIRSGKWPELQTVSDGLIFCLEVGIKELAKGNQSEEGVYIAELSARTRRMELEDKVREMEMKTARFNPTPLVVPKPNLRSIGEREA